MRSIRWIAPGAALAMGLAGFAAFGVGPAPASAQGGMAYDAAGKSPGRHYYGYQRSRPLRPSHGYRQQRPAVRGYGYRAAPRASLYRSPDRAGSCGEFKYWDYGKGRCLDARTSPPDLK